MGENESGLEHRAMEEDHERLANERYEYESRKYLKNKTLETINENEEFEGEIERFRLQSVEN